MAFAILNSFFVWLRTPDFRDAPFGRLDCPSKCYGPLINIAPFLTLFTSCSTLLFTEMGGKDEFKTRCLSLLSSDSADGIRSGTLTRKDCSWIHSYWPGLRKAIMALSSSKEKVIRRLRGLMILHRPWLTIWRLCSSLDIFKSWLCWLKPFPYSGNSIWSLGKGIAASAKSAMFDGFVRLPRQKSTL